MFFIHGEELLHNIFEDVKNNFLGNIFYLYNLMLTYYL